jgi:hypothetical protein
MQPQGHDQASDTNVRNNNHDVEYSHDIAQVVHVFYWYTSYIQVVLELDTE